MQTTKIIKKGDNAVKWVLIDAKDVNLGRIAVKAATALLGKKKLTYTPNLFSGDNVIIINAKEVSVSPKKVDEKMYYHYSGFPGGLTTVSFNTLMAKSPKAVIKNAVKGMLPHTKMGDEILKHLYVYADATYPQTAQQPTKLN